MHTFLYLCAINRRILVPSLLYSKKIAYIDRAAHVCGPVYTYEHFIHEFFNANNATTLYGNVNPGEP